MDKSNNDIFTALVKSIFKGEKLYLSLGIVKEVIANGYIMTPNDGNPDIEVINLDKSSVKIIPAVGALAICAYIDNINAYSIMVNGVSDVVINGGANGGLIIVSELVKQLDIVTDRIDIINDALKNSATGVEDGGALYKTNIGLTLDTQLEKEDYSNITNDKVKH